MSEKLAGWMEARGVGQQLQAWINNDVIAMRNYAVLEDMMVSGSATVKFTLTSDGYLKVVKASTFEGEAARCETELREAKKTIKELEKTVDALETTLPEATVAEEAEAVETKVRRVRRA